jgi:D-threo-aldose 1-dehydrogenase
MPATELRKIGSTDLSVTAVGFGSAPLGNRFRVLDESHCRALMDDAWNEEFAYSIPHRCMGTG